MASGIVKGMAGSPGLPRHSAEKGGGCHGKTYKLIALSAPMCDGKTGKKCREVCLSPGRIYTLGRSRTCCDIIFSDARVSRQHCQLYLDPVDEKIYLFEGATATKNVGIGEKKLPLKELRGEGTFEIISVCLNPKSVEQNHSCDQALKSVLRFGTRLGNEVAAVPSKDDAGISVTSDEHGRNEEVKNRAFQILEEKVRPGEQLALSGSQPISKGVAENQLSGGPLNVEFDDAGVLNSSVCSGSSSMLLKKPSLNGLYVDGEKVGEGGHYVLNPGSEVSLIACTKEGKPVDPEFGEAVGFVVLVDYSRRIALPAGVDIATSSMSENADYVIGGAPSICSRKRRALDLSDSQILEEDTDFLVVKGKFHKGGSEVQPALLANSSHLVGKEHSRLMKTSTKIRPGVLGKQLSRGLRVNSESSKKEMNQGRLQEKKFRSGSCTDPNVQDVVLSIASELPLEEISRSLINKSKPSTVLRKHLLEATCQFLSASDCARQLRRGKPERGSSSQTTLTDAIQVAVRDAVVGGSGEPKIPIQAQGQPNLASGEGSIGPDGISKSCVGAKDFCGELFPRNMRAAGVSIIAADTSDPSNAINKHEGNIIDTGLTLNGQSKCKTVNDENKAEHTYVKVSGDSKGRIVHKARPRWAIKDMDSKDLGRISSPAVSKSVAHKLDKAQTYSGFLLNRLEGMASQSKQHPESVSLQDLLTPTNDLLGLFVATFTSDIPWFLSSQNFSPDLPVTIACHDYDQCWSTSDDSRSCSPFPKWPNVTIVYPPFPDSCCFATEKRQGIGCHHPKIFLLPRQNCLRVIVTSANLSRCQWLNVTNSIWWQDFPRKDACDYESLFDASEISEAGLILDQTRSDFAVHLSSFVASLVADVPSAAHWTLDLANYDFSDATASLVTSIPGLHGCPCPPVPHSILEVVNRDSLVAKPGGKWSRKYLASMMSTVVGVYHRFKGSADPCGKRIRALAALLNDTNLQETGMLTVQLKRTTNINADPNAVSVIVTSEAACLGTGMVIGNDTSQVLGECVPCLPDSSVQLGFLPRSVAKWVAPLYDSGLCTFAARIWPLEALGVASGIHKTIVQLVLYVFEGQNFALLPAEEPVLLHKVALSCLLRSMDRPLGLWRLHQILSKYKWLDSAETSFVYGSSSVGTSLDPAFLAAFSAAAGKKLPVSDFSDESDPGWGAWTAENEANSPSIGLVFPTIERIRTAIGGPCSHQGLLCFAEATWERLKSGRLLHDAVPYPAEREGIPMHVKVAQRRFQNKPGEAPYGWIYSGSHNFSPAAWGRPLTKIVHPCKCTKTAFGCTLFISNYEAGLIFIEPPPTDCPGTLKFKPLAVEPEFNELKRSDLIVERLGLDRFVLPFCVPAPKYKDVDYPATRRAIYRAVVEWRTEQLLLEAASVDQSEMEMASIEADDSLDEIQLSLESQDTDCELSADMQMEEEYGDTLWSQLDSIQVL